MVEFYEVGKSMIWSLLQLWLTLRSLIEKPGMSFRDRDGIETETYGERESSGVDRGVTKEDKHGIKCGCGKAEGCG